MCGVAARKERRTPSAYFINIYDIYIFTELYNTSKCPETPYKSMDSAILIFYVTTEMFR